MKIELDDRDPQFQGQPLPISATTRRGFLGALGKAGGAALMFETMSAMGLFRSPSEARADDSFEELKPGGKTAEVLVLGGGIAGLTTAYELLKGGYKVTLLEARHRPGGRNWTARGGTRETEIDGPLQVCNFARGQYMNMGPARLPQGHITIDYCRELGVELQIFGNQNADGYYFNENTATTNYGALASKPVRHRTAKADYYGYVSELLAKVTDQGALDAELTDADKERLIEFLRSFGDIDSVTREYTGSSRRGYTQVPGAGAQPGVPLGPPPSVSDVLASRMGLNFQFEFGWDQAMLMFQPVGGMDQIPYAFERAVRKLGGKIIYGAEVTEIKNTAQGVTVGFTVENRFPLHAKADYAVCCIPPMVLASIDSNFSPAVMDALVEPLPVNVGKVGLQYGRRWWEEDERLISGITNTNLNIGTIWYPSYNYLGEKGVVVGSYNFGANALLYEGFTPEQRIAEAVKQGSKIHGANYATQENGFTVQWRRIKYNEGGWVSWESREKGYLELQKPDGNVYFAGDHLSYEIAWQAGAIYTARKAIAALVARVNATAQLDVPQLARTA